MTRQKLKKYAFISADPWVIKWYENPHELFVEERKNHKRTVLELACGRAEYTVWLSQLSPDTLFIWVDTKWDRIAVWLAKIREMWLQNARFVCGIIHHLENWFSAESIDEIWVVHPDPRPKWRDEKRRLTHPKFLQIYKNLLKKGGVLRLQTDSQELFQYSLEEIGKHSVGWNTVWKEVATTTDLYADEELLADHYGIQTHYEKEAIEEWKTICYGVWEKNNI